VTVVFQIFLISMHQKISISCDSQVCCISAALDYVQPGRHAGNTMHDESS
jgi:hypothetical protein